MDRPLASAAQTSARLVIDFEPGSVTRASTGPGNGATGNGSASAPSRQGSGPPAPLT
ncbi:MAG: hypothetical protein IPG46_10625 [Actinobacteria bacterium]|nr:hypothetical protein [Actinomycetota bacterium]